MQKSSSRQASSQGWISKLFSYLWRFIGWLRVTVFNLLFLAIIVTIILAVLPKEPVQLPDNIALHIAPSGFLVDQRSYSDPLTQLLDKSRPQEAETLVRDLVTAIDQAAKDKRITSLVLELGYLLGGGVSKLEEIGQALQRFKDSGKTIIAFSDNYSQQQYYLASYADDIYLHPMGSVLLTGYGSYRNYFKSALEKLSINFHVFRVGQYKDFVEPYTRNNMSDASREHNAQWLNELWGAYTSRVESLRNLPKGAINEYIANLDKNLAAEHGNGAQLAIKTGLVDHLKGRLEIRKALIQKVGADPKSDSYRSVDYLDYLSLVEQTKPHYSDKIGLLVAKGTIIDGEQPAGDIGGDSFAQLLRDVREDTDIKALVIRIDSGGGSAFASEVIREEISATRDAGIPVIISMGSVAASGGYWITAGADEIWAMPTTITGSIGVFGVFPTIEKSLEKLGIHTDGLGTTELAGAIRLDRALSPLAQNIIQQGVEDIYQRFIVMIAEARESTPELINTIAQGRVWSGAVAKDIGLVDELGYLNDAIAAAAERAEIKDYEVKLIEKSLSPSELLFRELANGHVRLSPQAVLTQLPQTLREFIMPFSESLGLIAKMNDPRYIYTQCLMCVAP